MLTRRKRGLIAMTAVRGTSSCACPNAYCPGHHEDEDISHEDDAILADRYRDLGTLVQPQTEK